MLAASYGREVESLRHSLLLQGQKLDGTQQRVSELETLLTKKEHLIAEQKKFLEDVKGQARAELQASDSRYQAQRRISQLLQTELLQLYSRVEMDTPTSTSTKPTAEGSVAKHTPAASSVTMPDRPGQTHSLDEPQHPHGSPQGNGSTLPPALSSSMNGSQEHYPLPPLLMEPSPLPCPHADAPLTVGSYPSAKSFLGMRARELFRNKSESQCDEEHAPRPPPRLSGLAHGLKTDLCVEPPCPRQTPKSNISSPASTVTVSAKEGVTEPRARLPSQESPRRKVATGGRGHGSRPRQQQLKIMDYNETHHEHS